MSGLRVGIIGCGSRAAWIGPRCLRAVDAEITFPVIADPDSGGARQRLCEADVSSDSARFVASTEELLGRSDELDGIIIATRCNLHTPIAIQVAATGLPVFLEKPVSITDEQLRALHDAYVGRDASVVVSFPLSLTPMFQEVLRIVRCGRLGTINQVQATNYVRYGGVYFGQWYRDHETNGGLWLQKATHDFDCINHIVRAEPTAVVATSTRKIYGGDLPADLECSTCRLRRECPESPEAIALRDDDGGMGRGDHACAFSESIRHHDAGSALITYADGTHAAYSQNFVSRRSAARRGARVTGYLGTLSFDWCTGAIEIIEHHGEKVEKYKVEVVGGHDGGDDALARNFIDVMRRRDVSRATLHDGLLSAAMCLAARTSETSRRLEPVLMPGIRSGSHRPHINPQQPPRVRVFPHALTAKRAAPAVGEGAAPQR